MFIGRFIPDQQVGPLYRHTDTLHNLFDQVDDVWSEVDNALVSTNRTNGTHKKAPIELTDHSAVFVVSALVAYVVAIAFVLTSHPIAVALFIGLTSGAIVWLIISFLSQLMRNLDTILMPFFKTWGIKLGGFCLLLGAILLPFVVLLSGLSKDTAGISALMFGLLSIGLGLIALELSLKQNDDLTDLKKAVRKLYPLAREGDTLDVASIIERRDALVHAPTAQAQASANAPTVEVGDVNFTPKEAEMKLTGHPLEVTIRGQTKEEAQARLDKAIKDTGKPAGEVYQLEDGSWGIRWVM